MGRAKTIWVYVCVCILLFSIAIALTWTLRGAYDKLFMLEGTILLVNTTDQPIDVTLDFPSGKQRQCVIPARGQFDLIERDTGEGSIGVSIPGKASESVGYVTTLNRIIVLSIDHDNTTFSQIIP